MPYKSHNPSSRVFYNNQKPRNLKTKKSNKAPKEYIRLGFLFLQHGLSTINGQDRLTGTALKYTKSTKIIGAPLTKEQVLVSYSMLLHTGSSSLVQTIQSVGFH